MQTVSDIRAQKRRANRFSIYLDGQYAFSLPLSLVDQVSVGQQLTEREVEALRYQGAVKDACARSSRYLMQRPRSRAEVERYLERKDYTSEVVDGALRELEQLGFLDDLTFAEFWVANRQDFKPRSEWALRQELRQKGVSNQIIDQVVQGIDDHDGAYRAGKSRARRYAGQDYQTFSRRLGGFLQRRGFRYGVVKDIVEKLWQEHEDGEW